MNPANSRVEGKLVDLDPEQQMVSQIWGLRVLLGGPGQPIQIVSDFEPSAFADHLAEVSHRASPIRSSAPFSRVYSTSPNGSPGSGSRFLNELAAGGAAPKQLSIKFLVDGFDDDFTSSNFTLGRVVGAIGVYSAGEPHHFVAGRCLSPLPTVPRYRRFRRCRSTPPTPRSTETCCRSTSATACPPSPPADRWPIFNNCASRCLPPSQAPVVLEVIDYTSPTWYTTTAGIVTIRLTADQQRLAATTPLGIVQVGPQGVIPVLSEAPNGLFIRADEYVFRLNPGDRTSTTFFATTLWKAPGQPADHAGVRPQQHAGADRPGARSRSAACRPSAIGIPVSLADQYR